MVSIGGVNLGLRLISFLSLAWSRSLQTDLDPKLCLNMLLSRNVLIHHKTWHRGSRKCGIGSNRHVLNVFMLPYLSLQHLSMIVATVPYLSLCLYPHRASLFFFVIANGSLLHYIIIKCLLCVLVYLFFLLQCDIYISGLWMLGWVWICWIKQVWSCS